MNYPDCFSCGKPATMYCEGYKVLYERKEIIDKNYGYKKRGEKKLVATITLPMFKCTDCWLKIYGKTKNDDQIFHIKDDKPYYIIRDSTIKGISGKYYELPSV